MRRALALLLVLLLAGCAAAREPEEVLDWDVLPQEEPEEEPEPPAPEYPAAFSMAYHKDKTLDPILCGEGISQDVGALLYEPLFRLNVAFEPEPVLCESWVWDENGTACALTLRADALFQDGTALRARDVVDTLQRAIASERYAYRLQNVASVSANREGQVVIVLREPNRGLLSLLDIPIVKSGTEERLVPVGTGPYVFTSEEGSDRLRADPDWWQQKRLPVETIELVNTKDRASAMYLFSSRRVELLTVDPTDDLTAVTGQYEQAYQPTTILQLIGFNTQKGVFSSAEARAAFSRGIPRDILAEAQMAGLALAAQFPISPLSSLYPKELEQTYDREASSALAALLPEDAAGGEDGGGEESGTGPRSLLLLVNEEDAFRLTTARFIADSFDLPASWRIEVRSLPWEEYLAALEAGEFDLYFGEVRLSADWDLSVLLSGEGALNYGGYADELTETLLHDFSAGLDREGNARRLAERLLSQAPIAPVCFRSYTVITHPGVVEGLSPAPGGTFFRLEDWTVHLSE